MAPPRSPWRMFGWTPPPNDDAATIPVTDERGQEWTLVPRPEETIPGVAIHDPDERVTINLVIGYRTDSGRRYGAPYVTRLEIVPDEQGEQVRSGTLQRLDLPALALAAADFLREQGKAQRSGSVLLFLEESRRRGQAPDLEELAASYSTAESIAELTAQYRSRYGVSRATVDRWIREARDRGLIPEATTGRKRKHTTTTTKENQ